MAREKTQTYNGLISKKQVNNIETNEQQFFNTPSSVAVELTKDVIISGGDLITLISRKKDLSKGTLNIFLAPIENQSRTITESKSKYTINLGIENIENLNGVNRGVLKLFIYNLITINNQIAINNLENGKSSKDYIEYNLQDLVNCGMYQSLDTARKGFKNSMDVLTSLKVSGTIKKYENDKKPIKEESLYVLFTDSHIANNVCNIGINTHFNWQLLAQGWTITPKSYFSLPFKPGILLLYICDQARIKRTLNFELSFRAIRDKLNLPNENISQARREIIGDTEQGRRERKGILGAIEELKASNPEIETNVIYNANESINEILKHGKVSINITGATAINISKNIKDSK